MAEQNPEPGNPLNGSRTESDSNTEDDPAKVTERMVNMALEDEDDDDADFLSASDGESEEDKIQEWEESHPDQSSGTLDASQRLSSSPCADPKTDNSGDSVNIGKVLGSGDDEEKETFKEEDDKSESRTDGGGDIGEQNEDEDESEESKAKKEEELERIRQEAEDALTEEERQNRLAEAVKLKTDGNDSFKNSSFTEAIDLYTKGLDVCPLKYVQQRSIMLSNRAACHMREERYEEASKDCSKSIDLQPTYIKALNRRADAYEKLEKLEDALKDHQKILELDRTQAASYHTSIRLEKEIKERNEKMKEEMMGKLKDLGNMVLRPFGLSTNNFQLNQDQNTGGYSVQFVQSPPKNGN